jgi:methanogenic corrinoid protein MtbC1
MPRRSASATTEPPRDLSIGDLAAASGIAEGTLRAWERRYGRPKARRLASGHRRYSPTDLTWLRRVAEALARGGRASEVVLLPEAELNALLAETSVSADEQALTERLLELVEGYDAARLRRSLREAMNRMEPLEFLEERVAPLLEAVGRRWADGRLDVRHEHFLSEVVGDLLRTQRERMSERATGPLVLLATLPGEQHELGLQMAATALLAAGARPRVLGPETPPEEIVRAQQECRAHAVAVSVSLASGSPATDRALARLRDALPSDVPLAAGGAGMKNARRGPPGVVKIVALAELPPWVEALERGA